MAAAGSDARDAEDGGTSSAKHVKFLRKRRARMQKRYEARVLLGNDIGQLRHVMRQLDEARLAVVDCISALDVRGAAAPTRRARVAMSGVRLQRWLQFGVGASRALALTLMRGGGR